MVKLNRYQVLWDDNSGSIYRYKCRHFDLYEFWKLKLTKNDNLVNTGETSYLTETEVKHLLRRN